MGESQTYFSFWGNKKAKIKNLVKKPRDLGKKPSVGNTDVYANLILEQ